MSRKLIATAVGALVWLFLIPLPCYGAGGQITSRDYEGRWWLSISRGEQTGFINGYLDCYFYEYKGSARFSDAAYTYRHALTKYFRAGGSSALRQRAGDVLLEFHDPKGYKVIDKYAQPINAPHGGDDGLYWMQLSLSKDEQLGFVEGYLACHAQLNHSNGGTFSKPPSEYVALINRWYRFDPATGDVDANRQSAAIADVLFRFRDRSQ